MVHDWSNNKCVLNEALVTPPVEYGDMAFMRGVDSQDSFLRWLVSPECWCYLGVRYPVLGRFGVYLFLPFGLGPSPGWHDRCVKEILRISRLKILSLRIPTSGTICVS